MSVPLRVAVRIRPPQPHDGGARGPPSVTQSEANPSALTIACDGTSKEFQFDHVFGAASSQHDVFTICALPLVEAVLSGMNGCIFAFGQTGAGKTHSMLGPEGGRRKESQDGILPRAAGELFRRIARLEADAKHVLGADGFSAYEVTASFVEVYRENAFDLLSSAVTASRDPAGACNIREQLDPPRVFAEGATEIKVSSVAKLLEVVAKGASNRATAATGVHAHSSRSHALLILSVEHRWRDVGDADGHLYKSRISRLTLVDLAGSETMERSHGGSVDAAGVGTNMGLLVLGRVIHALAAGQRVPYRDSTLTRLLQTSLGGTAVTQMLACVSPADIDTDQTLRTLQYAASARDVRCAPEIARVREELDTNPMIGDFDDDDILLNRRAIWIETPEFGDVFARCVGDSSDPLILYVHGSGPCNSSMFWNSVIMDMTRLSSTNSKGLPKSFFHVAIDCPGYGRSPHDKQTIRSYPGAFLSSVVRALGRRSAVAMCGSSQGCAGVFNATLEFPKLASSLAVCHPVAHAPHRFTALTLPTLLIFDTEDAGHPVSVGRQMRRYLPNNHYFEFTRSKDGDWEAANFADKLIQLLAEDWNTIAARRLGGRLDSKLPELTRVAGGFRAWNEVHGREHPPMESDSYVGWAEDSVPEGEDGLRDDDDNVWRAILHGDTNTLQYEHVKSGRIAKIRPPGARILVEKLEASAGGVVVAAGHRKPIKEARSLFEKELESEDEEDRLERLQQEASQAAEERKRENTQLQCDLCGNALISPVRLSRCRCALCGCCVEKTVRYIRQCPVCGEMVEKTKGGKVSSDAEELCKFIATSLADLSHPSAEGLQLQAAQLQELTRRRTTSKRIVLEFGNTVTAGGSKTSYTTFLKTPMLEGFESLKNPVSRVDFNINPGYSKPTATVRDPDPKVGALFEYSMARSYPCFMTVHFRSDLALPAVSIEYEVQDSSTHRRLVLDLPAIVSSGRRPKQAVFDADPPRNGWLSLHGSDPEVTYLPSPESPGDPMGPKEEALATRVPKAKAKPKSKSGVRSSVQTQSPGRSATPPLVRKERSDELKDKFVEADVHGVLTEALDCSQLAEILRAGNPTLSDADVKAFFNALEKDEHGKVQFDRVCDFVYGVQS